VIPAHEVHPGPSGAPTIVLSNSLGTTRAMWDPQLPALLEHATVVRYDARGHGASATISGAATIDDLVDDAIELLDALRLNSVHWVGLSLGGMTGMRLGAREPGRLERLTVLCTSAFLPPATGWTDRAAAVRAGGTAAVADAVLDRWFTPAFTNRESYRAMLASIDAEGYAACCEAIATMELRADLALIQAPVVAIAGADDPATPPPHLATIAEKVPDGRLVLVKDAAHLANVEQPDAVTAAIMDVAWTR
jgi:3-oxoadipate enol-lactonase